VKLRVYKLSNQVYHVTAKIAEPLANLMQYEASFPCIRTI